jgi:hypothetical protein
MILQIIIRECRTTICLVGSFFALSVVACGQQIVPRLANPFGDFSVGARNISMADANMAESYDVSSMYENPAALAFIKDMRAFFNHSQGSQSNGMEEDIAYPIRLDDLMVMGIGANLYHSGFVTQPAFPQARVIEVGYDISIVRLVTSTVGVGGTVSVTHGSTMSGSHAWGATYSLGLSYSPSGSVSYGLVFKGLGTSLEYSSPNGSEPFVASSTRSTQKLEIGASMRYPSAESLRYPILILSMANEKYFETKGLFYKGGIEVRPLRFLQLRFGYIAGPSLAQPRYGIGLLRDSFSVEYAVYPQFSTIFQQFSVAMEL